jgi:hypothetical protein
MMGRWGGRSSDKSGARDTSLKDQARKLVIDLLYARRNGDLKQEQRAHERLASWCQKNNVNMENAIAGVVKEKSGSVAALMGGLV